MLELNTQKRSDQLLKNIWARYKTNIFEHKISIDLFDNEPEISLNIEPMNSHLQDKDDSYNQSLIPNFIVGTMDSSLKDKKTLVPPEAYNTISTSPPRWVEEL